MSRAPRRIKSPAEIRSLVLKDLKDGNARTRHELITYFLGDMCVAEVQPVLDGLVAEGLVEQCSSRNPKRPWIGSGIGWRMVRIDTLKRHGLAGVVA